MAVESLTVETVTHTLEVGSPVNATLEIQTSGSASLTLANTGVQGPQGITGPVGGVDSVALSAPTGFDVDGSPGTGNVSISLSYTTGYSLPLDSDQANWNTAYSWGDHSVEGYLDTGDIGTTVQSYSVNLDNFSSKAAPTGDVVGTTDLQTLTNKTLSVPKIRDGNSDNDFTIIAADLAVDRNITLPLLTSDDTFVFQAHSQTLTNKTISTGSTYQGDTITVPYGGTGRTSLTNNNVILGSGTSAVNFVAPGTSGNVLTSNGTTWQSTTPTPPLEGITDNSSPFTTTLGSGTGDPSGSGNTCVGYGSGEIISTGTYNVTLGFNAGDAITTGSHNIAIGNDSDVSATQSDQIAIGRLASSGSSSSVAIGKEAKATGSTISLGFEAGKNSLSPSNSVHVGVQAGYQSDSTENVFVGRNSGYRVTGGNAFGNVAVGPYCMGNISGTASGAQQNVAVGYNSLNVITSGDNNTCIGTSSGVNITTGSNNSCVGNGSQPTSATASNEFTLGNSSITTLRCQQTSITSLSDERDKDNIYDLNVGLDFVNSLRPVNFTWNLRDGSRTDDIVQSGFIAQEVKSSIQAHASGKLDDIIYEPTEDRLEMKMGDLIPAMVQAIKDLSAEVEDLKTQIESLQK